MTELVNLTRFGLISSASQENFNEVSDKPVKNDTGEMSMSEEAKQNAQADHLSVELE